MGDTSPTAGVMAEGTEEYGDTLPGTDTHTGGLTDEYEANATTEDGENAADDNAEAGNAANDEEEGEKINDTNKNPEQPYLPSPPPPTAEVEVEEEEQIVEATETRETEGDEDTTAQDVEADPSQGESEEVEGEGEAKESLAEDEAEPIDEKEELTKEIFGDSDDDTFDVPEPVDYKESEDDEDFADNTKKLRRLAKNSKRKRKSVDEGENERVSGGEEEEEEEVVKPEKPRKKSKGKKKKEGDTPKKRRASVTGDSGDESDSERKPTKESDVPELDAALERIKKKRPKKINDDTLEPILHNLLDKMDEAAANDVKSNESREPAINKIRMLAEVTQALNKAPYVSKFLEMDGLKSIKRWLDPMPDGSLPNIRIREQLLAILAKMPIDTSHLQSSDVGKVVMFLLHHSTESRENKKVCQALIEKWSRPIFNLSARYEDLEAIETESAYRKTPRKQAEEVESALDRMTKEQIKDTRRHHASIPRRLPMDFVVRPTVRDLKSDTHIAKNLGLLAQSADKRIKQKLTKGRNPAGRKVLRAEKISIEGRGYK